MKQKKYWISDIALHNYCGYEDCRFDFTNNKGFVNPINVLYGPNGCGKTNLLDIINILGNSGKIIGRNSDLLFRKMTYNLDYDPSLPHFDKNNRFMTVEAIFVDEEGNPAEVEITNEGVTNIGDFDGVRKMNIPRRDVSVYIDADHTMNMNRFQIPADRVKQFTRMAEAVYGYKVELGSSVTTSTSQKFNKNILKFYQDFVLVKGKTRVHFKRMSAGEKKIATLLRNLCAPNVIDTPGIVLIDNIELHIYMKRHHKVIDALLEEFPTKQFIVTTHSPIVIEHVAKTYGEECLFDVSAIKGEEILEEEEHNGSLD